MYSLFSIFNRKPQKTERKYDEDWENEDDRKNDADFSTFPVGKGSPNQQCVTPQRGVERIGKRANIVLGDKVQKAFISKGNDLSIANIGTSPTRKPEGLSSRTPSASGGGAPNWRNQLGTYNTSINYPLIEESTIPFLMTKDGSILNIEQLSISGDNELMNIRGKDDNNVYQLDIPTGKIVNYVGGPESTKINRIAHVTKSPSKDKNELILGVSTSSVFTLDPRINAKDKTAQRFRYSKPIGLQCISSTDDGNVLYSSDNNYDLRLSNSIDKKAKSCIPFSDKIVHTDVTKDGRFVLATTPYYLMILPTEIGEFGRTKNGYNQSITANAELLKLQLSTEDMLKHRLDDVYYTSSYFNRGEDEEKYILASIGNLIVLWDFTLLKKDFNKYKGRYQIQVFNKEINEKQFVYGEGNDIVVNMYDKTYLHHLS